MSFKDTDEFKAPQPYIRNKLDPILAIERRWKLYDGRRACTPMDIREFGLSLDKGPPPIRDWWHDPTRGNSAESSSASNTTDTPPAATSRPSYFLDSARASEARRLAPFDLYDLPEAMRAEDFPIAAKFAERWLNGRRFDAHRYDYKKRKMVEGRYDADMIDTGTVKLRWLFRFGSVESKFNRLLTKLHNTDAVSALRRKLRQHVEAHSTFFGWIDTIGHCRGDLQQLHDEFQFQYVGVNMYEAMLAAPTTREKWMSIGMTDVSAALGNFAFYATVARAHIERGPNGHARGAEWTRRIATVTHIHAYMRDSYSFQDRGSASQYLGHWNKRGMILLPGAAIAHFMAERFSDYLPDKFRLEADEMALLPVTIKDRLAPEYVYYPVRNRDFQAWRAKHRRGGDFLIYSDIRTIKLRQPIHVDLETACDPR